MDSFALKCDHMFDTEDGTAHFIEVMFSSRFRLASDLAEVLLRIHPAKKAIFNHLLRDNASAISGAEKNLVEIAVNTTEKGGLNIPYAEIATVRPKSIQREIEIEGFDHNADPVVRWLDDGSLRVIFCNMPPLAYAGQEEFDMEHFGEGLQQCCDGKLSWEDRDIFYAPQADASLIRKIQDFISGYAKPNLANNQSIRPAESMCRTALPYFKVSTPVSGAGNNSISIELERRPFVDPVSYFYVADREQGLVFLQSYHLEQENITRAQLHAHAMENLKRLCDSQLTIKKMGAVNGVTIDGNFEVSSVLLDELWDHKLRPFVTESFVIAMPERSVLAFCDSASAEGIAMLKEIVERVFNDPSSQRYLLSKDLFQRVNGQWQKWDPHSHSLADAKARNIDAAVQQKMKSHAEKLRHLIKEKMNLDLQYDAKSFSWINNYIEKLSEKTDLKNRDSLIHLLAVFSGECFIQQLGGYWLQMDDGTVIASQNRTLDPFELTRKQMNRQADTSLYKIFQAPQGEIEIASRSRTHEAAIMPQLTSDDVRKYKMAAPPWLNDDPLNQLFSVSDHLLKSGSIIWAGLIQANRKLFVSQSGILGAPAEIIYDPQGRATIDELAAACQSTFALKDSLSIDPQQKAIGDHLNAETSRLFGHPLPHSLSNAKLRMSSIWIDKSYFLHGLVALPYFPVLISDQCPGYVLPVPADFWTPEFKAKYSERLIHSNQAGTQQKYLPPPEISHLSPFNLVEEGAIYFLGKDVPQDFAKAKSAFERAIAQGSTSGYEWLAKMYDAGSGVPKDAGMALSLREKARALIQSRQTTDTSSISSATKDNRNNEAQSREDTPKESDSPGQALFLKGLAHYTGNGAVKSISQARSYWKQAAKLGHPDSLHNLACMYFDGEFAKPDRRTAMAYFEEAARQGCKESRKFLETRRKTLLGAFEWGFRKKDIFKQ